MTASDTKNRWNLNSSWSKYDLNYMGKTITSDMWQFSTPSQWSEPQQCASFTFNGSSYFIHRKSNSNYDTFYLKNSIQVAQTLLFTINLTEHVLVWSFHVCYGFILESVVYSLNSALDIGPCNPWCLIISWYLKKHLYSFRHRGIRQTLHS